MAALQGSCARSLQLLWPHPEADRTEQAPHDPGQRLGLGADVLLSRVAGDACLPTFSTTLDHCTARRRRPPPSAISLSCPTQRLLPRRATDGRPAHTVDSKLAPHDLHPGHTAVAGPTPSTPMQPFGAASMLLSSPNGVVPPAEALLTAASQALSCAPIRGCNAASGSN